jgi:hypothetical protein
LYCLGNENVFCGNNNCEEFNNIKLIKGYPALFKSANEEIKKRLKFAFLNEDCEVIDEFTFKNYINLVEIDLPEKVSFILNEAFANCNNLEKIEINENIEEIANDAFLNCNNLVKIKCNPKFLKIFEKNRIKEINLICSNLNEIKDLNLNNFKNLEKIEIPSNIKSIPENTLAVCPNLTEIKCSPELLNNLNNKDKQFLKEIEIPNVSKINDEIFKGLDNIYNIKIPPNVKIPQIKNQVETTIEELEKLENNKKYCEYIRKIINQIKTGKIKNEKCQKNSLLEISSVTSKVCLEIKNKSKKKISPHPVQILTIIKLVDCLLNNKDNKYKKGAIAEVKTGEGKSYIIAVLAIILSKFYGKKIDIVTSTVELAKRDEEDQKEYYNLFKIGSGVLFNKESDKDYMNLNNLVKKDNKEDEEKQFNLKVFDNEIVYSTNSNFEFVYLFSLFRKKTLRSRPYDVVIVDEVDNMFLDQASSPAIIASSFPTVFSSDILEVIFIMQNQNVDEIMKVLNYYFNGVANFTESLVNLLKKAALIATEYEYNVDYIIENNEVIIIDKTTGYKKIGSRWSNYIHEMVEIKEKIKVHEPQVSFCSITQYMFFNQYDKIIGVTGTLGDLNDQQILQENYSVYLFKIPRNIPPRKPIYYKNRPNNKEKLYLTLQKEIYEFSNKGRPVLVILDSPKHVEEFSNYISNCKKIQGLNAKEDKEAIEKAGESSSITIATSAAGRGMDIKPSKESLKNGGLHVIIPFNMPNKRVLEQAIGRSARQGQPGSATVYQSANDRYYKTPQFKQVYINLMKLQNLFSLHIRTNWGWIYDYPIVYGLDYLKIPFGVKMSDLLILYSKGISEYIIEKESEKITKEDKIHIYCNLFNQMIFKSWGLFYSEIDKNINKYSDYDKCYNEYQLYLNELHVWMKNTPNTSIDDQISFFQNLISIQINWDKIIINGIKIASLMCCIIFPDLTPIMSIAGNLLTDGLEIYNKLSKNEPIKWGSVILDVLGYIVNGLCLPGLGEIEMLENNNSENIIHSNIEIVNNAGNSLGKFLNNVAKSNCSLNALVNSFKENGMEILSAKTLKMIGKKFMSSKKYKNKIINNNNNDINFIRKGEKDITYKIVRKFIKDIKDGILSYETVINKIIEKGFIGTELELKEKKENENNFFLFNKENIVGGMNKKQSIENSKEILKNMIKQTVNDKISEEKLTQYLINGGFVGNEEIDDDFFLLN